MLLPLKCHLEDSLISFKKPKLDINFTTLVQTTDLLADSFALCFECHFLLYKSVQRFVKSVMILLP